MDNIEYVWLEYDPSWLIPLAEKSFPDKPWILDALKNCTKAMRKHAEVERLHMTYFVDPKTTQWKFKANEVIRSWSEGEIVLDILEGNIIGAIEFGIKPPLTRRDLEVASILQKRNIKVVK